MRKLIRRLGTMWTAASPYVILLIVVPGGAMLALLLFLHRRKQVTPLRDGPLVSEIG